MKSNRAPIVPGQTRPVACIIATWSACALLSVNSGLGADDTNLSLSLGLNNQNVVLSWFGSNAVRYQVESSSNLLAWANSSSVITGASAFVFVTNPVAGQLPGFYRVQRLFGGSATFNPGTGVLTINGDDSDNIITVSRDVAGVILVNNGAVPVTGGTPTVANTTLIQIFGGKGNDQLSFNEANGAMPRGQFLGEEGDDTLTGGSGADLLNGGPGSDTLLGKGGSDNLLGGDDNDTIIGGDADDIALMGNGNDRFIWNPGDDTDVVEGEGDIDTVEVNGGNGAEAFSTSANGARVRFDRVNPAPFSLDIGTCEFLVLNANGGDDSFSAVGGLAALIQITVDGGEGNDTILGGNGSDVLRGGPGDDTVDGNQGNDTIFLGAGNDTFQWDPGDGSDTIYGEAGTDKLLFNASNAAEIVELLPNGSLLRVLRNIGNIVLDCDDVEQVQINMLGGADVVTVNDLSGTDATQVNIDLASPVGSGTGDAQIDSIILNGTGANNTATVSGSSGTVSVAGLSPTVTIAGSEPASDRLTLYTFAGDDVVDASGLAAGVIGLTVDGGDNDDYVTGSSGDDTLLGGAGDDVLIGGPGTDVLDGGTGSNIVIQ